MVRVKQVKRDMEESDGEFMIPLPRHFKRQMIDDGKGDDHRRDNRYGKRPKRDVKQLGKRLFKVGIDYGTAYVAVAYAVVEPGVGPKSIAPTDIRKVQDYPDDLKDHGIYASQVPNVSWYCDDTPETIAGIFVPGPGVVYGYSVQQQLGRMGLLKPGEAPFRRIERAKLLLSEDQSTEEARCALAKKATRLKADRFITEDTDIIRDQLVSILRHTKQELEQSANFDDYTCDVEFVATVPPTWRARADEMMIILFSSAALIAGFANASNIFLVSETEAAVNFLVESEIWDSETLNMGGTCTVLDCGGATCDIATLVVGRAFPVRLHGLIEEDGE
jgi:hypothetical protein